MLNHLDTWDDKHEQLGNIQDDAAMRNSINANHQDYLDENHVFFTVNDTKKHSRDNSLPYNEKHEEQ